jgi:hypothetical protein
MQFPSKTVRVGLTAFLAVAIVVSARAVEPDKFIPSDSEAVVVLNVQQILNSPLVKKYAMEQAKAALKGNDDANKFFKATGLDPFQDIHKVILSASMNKGAEPKILILVRGKFDVEKIQAAIAEEAKAKGDEIKIVKKGDVKIYEIKAQGKPVFAAFADNTTLVLSQSSEQTEAGIKGGGKPSATLLTALEKLGGKESLYAAAVVTDDMKKGMAGNPQFKELAPKLQYITGIFDLTNDFKMKLAVQTSDSKAADKVKATLSQFVPLIGLMAAGQQEKLAPAVNELVKKIEIKKDDNNAVTVSLVVTEEMMKEMEKSAKDSAKDSDKGKQ